MFEIGKQDLSSFLWKALQPVVERNHCHEKLYKNQWNYPSLVLCHIKLKNTVNHLFNLIMVLLISLILFWYFFLSTLFISIYFWCTDKDATSLFVSSKFHQLVATFQQLSTNLSISSSCNKSVKNQACCNLLFVDFLQLVETTCSKPVDNKF